MTPHRFTNDILRPWDELNLLLVQKYAFQPDLSDISKMAGNISVSIRHQIDSSELSDAEANDLSPAHQIISDAGDYFKHGNLRNQTRNSPTLVSAAFEYREDGTYRFIRNIVTVEHASLGPHDFMKTSSEAIRFWISQKGFSLSWAGVPSEAPVVYETAVRLKYEPKYCIKMSQTRYKFFIMNAEKVLIPFDPPNVHIEVHE